MIEANQSHSQPKIDSRFDSLYEDLATNWESHQRIKFIQGTPIVELAISSQHLAQARDAMWTWWSQNKKGRNF